MPNPDDTQKQPAQFILYPQPCQEEDDEIDLLALFNVLKRRWRFIFGFPLACTLVAVVVVLWVLPVVYKSSAVLMPAEGSGETSKLAALAGSLPISIPGLDTGGESQNIPNFLNSRTLKQRLIDKYDLLPRLYPDAWDETAKRWKSDDPEAVPSTILALQSGVLDGRYGASKDEKTGLITLNWSDEDPAFAKVMVDRVIAELQYYLDNEYVSDARREREFVESQLAKASAELEYWERQVPSQNLTLDKIQRERFAAQTVYTELRKQLEIAKIAEAKQIVSFRVLDNPFVPVKKDRPKRTLICALTLVGTGFMALFLVLGHNFWIQARQRAAGTDLTSTTPSA
jgi:uncharacterized protein involved in exopolysaccharide biosynthesis